MRKPSPIDDSSSGNSIGSDVKYRQSQPIPLKRPTGQQENNTMKVEK